MTAYEMRISDWISDVCSSDLAGVHLQEVRLAAAGGHDEFDGASAGIVDGAGELERARKQFFAYRVGQVGGGRFLDDLLVIALHRAVAFMEMQGVALAVAEHLDFQMRSEEHTSELQSLMRISYAVFCLKKKKQIRTKLVQLEHKTM